MTNTNDHAGFTPMDPQSRAFRETTDADRWHDDVNTLIQRERATYHEPITDISQVRHPEDYEAEGWDDDRDGPKSVAEARNALAVRIADPSAADTDAEADAYEDLKG